MKSLPRLVRWVLSFGMVMLLLMTLYRLFFFFHYRGENRPFSGSAFLLGLRYDARVVSIIGLLILILSLFKPLHPFKNSGSQKFWTLFVSFLFLFFLIFYGVDFYHFDYLKQRLNASALNFLADANISAGMVWQTYPLLKISLLFAVLLFFFFKWQQKVIGGIHTRPADALSKKRIILIHLVFVLLLSGFTFGRIGQYPLRWSDAFDLTDDFKANTSLNPFQSFFSSLKFKDSKYDIAEVKKYYPLMSDYLGVMEKDSTGLNFKRKINASDACAVRPNIVVVICESFSAYKSSMFGNKLNPTPYFNELSNNGVFFERCFTPAFGTARGVWATITGIPDVESPKTSSRNPSAVDQHTIINDFDGYEKFYFLGGSTTWANIRGLLKNNINGLNIYEQDNFESAKVDVWGISDKNLFLESSKILAKQTRPFFAVIQTADNHRPYTIPEEDLKVFKKQNVPDDTLKKYGFEDNGQYNAFRYADFNFSKFIEAAKKEKYFNNTIFVFVGDHGLRGDAGGMFPQSFTKQGILAEHVPLLFYAPALLKPAKIKSVCSQVDIMSTIGSLAHQKFVNNTFGRNLFDTTDKKEKYAFIADPDLQTIGIVGDKYYFRINLKTGKEEMVSVVDDLPFVATPENQKLRLNMSNLTKAFYETAKYLLKNNKKISK